VICATEPEVGRNGIDQQIRRRLPHDGPQSSQPFEFHVPIGRHDNQPLYPIIAHAGSDLVEDCRVRTIMQQRDFAFGLLLW
jgi:hypothetical protein